ncbi:MAG: gliding motility-associated C-terminal domain-containing protein [Chitinophagaceae bacterium]
MALKLFRILLFLKLMIGSLYAQLCVGSLGDPIINITFAQGSNPGGSLTAATTSYQYVSNDCPGDGFYTVRNSTTSCFGNTWHTLNADHTGNAGGYFMLVNASFQPGAFYIDTVKGLCGNTTYEFAAWMINVLLPSACSGANIQPNLTMTVEKTDGTVLQTYNTGNIPPSSTPTWNQYGAFFTTAAGVNDIVLRIVNNAPGGCGNDLALDDITFRPCGPLIAATIDGVSQSTVAYCEGPARQFVLSCAISGGFTNPVFQWQQRTAANPSWADIPAATSNTFTASFPVNALPGVYEFRLAVAESGNINSLFCRIYSQPFTITINAAPLTTAANNGPACEGSALNLSATGGTNYTWNGPGAFAATGSRATISGVQINQAGKYYVLVASAAGCTHLDSTTVVVHPVPSATTGFVRDSICAKDSIGLTASGGTGFQWIPVTGLSNTAIANPKASPATTTTYSVIISNQFSCTDTAFSTVYIVPLPVANAGPDKIIFVGQSAQLSGSINVPGDSWSWSPAFYIDDIFSLQPHVTPPADQNYVLTVASAFGCGTASDLVLVKVFKDIFIPTAFTPDNNGLNDTWNILGLEALPTYRVGVYNRWGQQVFETKNEPRGWNGKFKGLPQPAGIYIYIIEKGVDKTLVKGSFMLIR